MRLSCEFKCDRFPITYHMMIVSLIKDALKKSNENYFKNIYLYDEEKANKRPKHFCFSVYMKDFKKQDDIFIINDEVIVNISTPDYEFFVNLYNGLLKIKEFKYKDFTINNVRMSILKEKDINETSILFNTLSPICIKDKNNKPIDINDERFEEELNYIVDKTLLSYRGYGLKKKLRFIPCKFKKVVVKQDIQKFKKNTDKKYYYVNAYSGVFKLNGNVQDLKDIYLLGLGFKRSQGFGMIEVLS
ncbi:CRISPR-associated protein, Cas6 family [Alkalithermobacter thermoalcaliphilus JW-YL-7 = DSM 7308]|uniref:CRISPR-associated protein Cas6 n=1 Tax=Alkalithermobacter thermoalcaliphilus JW-YL-7 = DSM 7308 TaxID=1121328 RepID=A0A150FQV0_CLOPD|nr:CRISPR-associated protein Cas6 [[Clostridium] paradoxum JW-YL-7 = DSM 7308]SHL29783.1 CRISPR-associated protein, Cas6 family [[Clostridium] paradoxum JW-YL-7 = DSM 7308]